MLKNKISQRDLAGIAGSFLCWEEKNMCSHLWVEINDVRVCKRCGMTISLLDGKIIFDRKFANAINKKGRKGK